MANIDLFRGEFAINEQVDETSEDTYELLQSESKTTAYLAGLIPVIKDTPHSCKTLSYPGWPSTLTLAKPRRSSGPLTWSDALKNMIGPHSPRQSRVEDPDDETAQQAYKTSTHSYYMRKHQDAIDKVALCCHEIAQRCQENHQSNLGKEPPGSCRTPWLAGQQQLEYPQSSTYLYDSLSSSLSSDSEALYEDGEFHFETNEISFHRTPPDRPTFCSNLPSVQSFKNYDRLVAIESASKEVQVQVDPEPRPPAPYLQKRCSFSAQDQHHSCASDDLLCTASNHPIEIRDSGNTERKRVPVVERAFQRIKNTAGLAIEFFVR